MITSRSQLVGICPRLVNLGCQQFLTFPLKKGQARGLLIQIAWTSYASLIVLFCLFRMTNLLRKFRIDFSAVIEVHGVNSLPSSQRY